MCDPGPPFCRYTHLIEESQLDSIPGMVYCPRPGCNKRTVSDPKESLAVCSSCSLPFCKLCRQVYHGTGPCPALQKVTVDIQVLVNPSPRVNPVLLELTPLFLELTPLILGLTLLLELTPLLLELTPLLLELTPLLLELTPLLKLTSLHELIPLLFE